MSDPKVTAASPDAIEVDPRDLTAPPLETEVMFVARNGLVIPAIVVEVKDQEKGIIQLVAKSPLHRGSIPDEPDGYAPDLIRRGIKSWHHAPGQAPTELEAAAAAEAEAAAALEAEAALKGEVVEEVEPAQPEQPAPFIPTTRLAETPEVQEAAQPEVHSEETPNELRQD